MDDCCSGKAGAVEKLRARQGATLRIVLAVNLAMFAIEFVSGILAGSIALLADSLDMLGDALVYGLSLYVISRDSIWKAWSAIAKACLMALFGLFVLGQMVHKIIYPAPPDVAIMGAVGVLALLANAACFALLWDHRGEDINMRSVWICSRNDLIANVLVLIAAASVWMTSSPWPDIVVGAVICAVFLRSAYTIAREAGDELRTRHAPGAASPPG